MARILRILGIVAFSLAILCILLPLLIMTLEEEGARGIVLLLIGLFAAVVLDGVSVLLLAISSLLCRGRGRVLSVILLILAAILWIPLLGVACL